MKINIKIFILVFVLFFCLRDMAHGQFVLVNLFPDNQPAFGMTNYPTESSNTVSSNILPGWSTNVTTGQYLQWESRSIILANSQQSLQTSNLFTFLSAYTNIGSGIIDTSNRINTISNLWQSIKSGTNSTGQLTTIQATMAQYDYINWVYMNNIVTLLQRLFPALQQIYQPANDPVGH
jgi:hypothetical protein